jgi:hypothetical protein
MKTLGTPDRFAVFSDDELYRYRLVAKVGVGPSRCAFLMLNPSKADHEVPDPTFKRCFNFARDWGFGWLEIWNCFAWRSTDASVLYDVADPVGPDNDRVIEEAQVLVQRIVCAWGAHELAVNRGLALGKLLSHRELFALRLTRDRDPYHPLYLPKNLKPFPFEPRRVA